MRVRSGVTWFEDDDYIGTTVSFPSGSTWKIQKKLKENEHYVHESLAQIEGMGFVSEARAVFIVTKLSGEGPQEAVIKIRMQYVLDPFVFIPINRVASNTEQGYLGRGRGQISPQ